ncbi:MAG TPA: hypothetical protein VK154_06595 [Chitinophagales bacterium]|nr:hypothetical protein [Chitinophagales bacterium]
MNYIPNAEQSSKALRLAKAQLEYAEDNRTLMVSSVRLVGKLALHPEQITFENSIKEFSLSEMPAPSKKTKFDWAGFWSEVVVSFLKPYQSLERKIKKLRRLIKALKAIQHVDLIKSTVSAMYFKLQSIRINDKSGEEINVISKINFLFH